MSKASNVVKALREGSALHAAIVRTRTTAQAFAVCKVGFTWREHLACLDENLSATLDAAKPVALPNLSL